MAWTNSIRRGLIEGYLNRFAAKPAIENTNWAIEPGELRDVVIRWPSRYQWHAASDWVDLLLFGFRRHVRVEMARDIPQDFKGTVVIQMRIAGDIKNIAIGYSDYLPIDEECARRSDLYFKMQFDARGYLFDNVVPGGYVPEGKRLYFQLRKLRKMRDERFFSYDVNGRFGLDYSREIREKAIGILNSQDKFQFQGGMNPVSYSAFLQEITRSKICIDLPGLGDFCFRLMNYMAIGSCIIAYPHRTRLHVPLIDRKHIVYCKEDFSDLIDLCSYYLQHDDERETLAANARSFFDLSLHKDNLTLYYLRTCLDRLR